MHASEKKLHAKYHAAKVAFRKCMHAKAAKKKDMVLIQHHAGHARALAAHHAGKARAHARFAKLCKKYGLKSCHKRHAAKAKHHAKIAKKHAKAAKKKDMVLIQHHAGPARKAAHHAGKARAHARFAKLCKKYGLKSCHKRHAAKAKHHAKIAKKHAKAAKKKD